MLKDRKTLIGRTFPPVTFAIHEEDVVLFLREMKEKHPAFWSDKEAESSGYGRRVIPPYLAPFFSTRVLLSFDWKEDFFVDLRTGTAMSGEHELEFLRPLYVGETLTIQGSIEEVYEKAGKKHFQVVVMRLNVTDANNSTALRGRVSYIILD